MAVSYCTPEKILHHAVVFILPRAPVMQVHIIFAKAVMLKKGVYPTDNSNHTVSSLISQEWFGKELLHSLLQTLRFWGVNCLFLTYRIKVVMNPCSTPAFSASNYLNSFLSHHICWVSLTGLNGPQYWLKLNLPICLHPRSISNHLLYQQVCSVLYVGIYIVKPNWAWWECHSCAHGRTTIGVTGVLTHTAGANVKVWIGRASIKLSTICS